MLHDKPVHCCPPSGPTFLRDSAMQALTLACFDAVGMKTILTTPTPHSSKTYDPKICRKINEGSYGVKIPRYKGTFTEKLVHEPTFVAHKLRLLWHTNPDILRHMSHFYWGWGWSSICWAFLSITELVLSSLNLRAWNDLILLEIAKACLKGAQAIGPTLPKKMSQIPWERVPLATKERRWAFAHITLYVPQGPWASSCSTSNPPPQCRI